MSQAEGLLKHPPPPDLGCTHREQETSERVGSTVLLELPCILEEFCCFLTRQNPSPVFGVVILQRESKTRYEKQALEMLNEAKAEEPGRRERPLATKCKVWRLCGRENMICSSQVMLAKFNRIFQNKQLIRCAN